MPGIKIANSTFRNGKEAIVRTDSSPNATVFLQNVHSQNVKYEGLAPEYTKVTGATNCQSDRVIGIKRPGHRMKQKTKSNGQV